MNTWQSFWSGIAPQHVPALIAALALPVLVLAGRRLAWRPAQEEPRPPLDPVRRLAAWLLGVAAAVHLALPLGHFDGVVLALLFLADGAAFAWLAMRVVEGRRWRLLSALLLSATLLAYLVVTGSGREEPDQVGIATALVELAALGLCLVPVREAQRPKRFQRFAASTGMIAVTLVVGTVIWVGAFLSRTPVAEGSTVDSAAAHQHGHDSAARAQAGVIMRLLSDPHPTLADEAGADRLAAATKQATRPFEHLDAALAAGYKLPKIARGLDVHLENPAYKSDGRVLDPSRPEMLVYAIDDRGATLLGVVFVMERAGVPGPTPGGPITRWHAHNLCLTALPPGFGIVSPFGGCPALSIDITSPEMMHVWVVPDPAGPFADGLDKKWVAVYHDTHVLPVV